MRKQGVSDKPGIKLLILKKVPKSPEVIRRILQAGHKKPDRYNNIPLKGSQFLPKEVDNEEKLAAWLTQFGSGDWIAQGWKLGRCTYKTGKRSVRLKLTKKLFRMRIQIHPDGSYTYYPLDMRRIAYYWFWKGSNKEKRAYHEENKVEPPWYVP